MDQSVEGMVSPTEFSFPSYARTSQAAVEHLRRVAASVGVAGLFQNRRGWNSSFRNADAETPRSVLVQAMTKPIYRHQSHTQERKGSMLKCAYARCCIFIILGVLLYSFLTLWRFHSHLTSPAPSLIPASAPHPIYSFDLPSWAGLFATRTLESLNPVLKHFLSCPFLAFPCLFLGHHER